MNLFLLIRGTISNLRKLFRGLNILFLDQPQMLQLCECSRENLVQVLLVSDMEGKKMLKMHLKRISATNQASQVSLGLLLCFPLGKPAQWQTRHLHSSRPGGWCPSPSPTLLVVDTDSLMSCLYTRHLLLIPPLQYHPNWGLLEDTYNLSLPRSWFPGWGLLAHPAPP